MNQQRLTRAVRDVLTASLAAGLIAGTAVAQEQQSSDYG